jgi:hypothetical protein
MYENVYVVAPTKLAVNNEGLAIDDAIILPNGYKEYLQKFHGGSYCGIAEVWKPEKILKENEERRTTWTDTPWWESDLLALGVDKNYLQIASSLEGDSLIFHQQSKQLYFLNRGNLTVKGAGQTLLEGLTAFVENVAKHPFKTPFFLTDGNEILYYQTSPETISYEDLVESVTELKIHAKSEVYDFDAYFFTPEIQGLINIYDAGCGEIYIFVYGNANSNSMLIERLQHHFAKWDVQ